jgi:predicted DNA-binding transcriptional regulator YafY
MARADRLYSLIQILRDGRLHKAGDLAFALGVSARTIWRDMETLMASGLPVEGERGVGYLLRAPVVLPPLTLPMAELEALRRGLAHVASGPDGALARAARALAGKVASVIPAAAFPDDEDLFVFSGEPPARPLAHLPILRRAIRLRRPLRMTVIEPGGGEITLLAQPLSIVTDGDFRTLLARAPGDPRPRRLRLDRIVALSDPAGDPA